MFASKKTKKNNRPTHRRLTLESLERREVFSAVPFAVAEFALLAAIPVQVPAEIRESVTPMIDGRANTIQSIDQGAGFHDFTAQAGHTYLLTIDDNLPVNVKLTVYRQLSTGGMQEVAYGADDGTVNIYNVPVPRIRFTAPASGTYSVAVSTGASEDRLAALQALKIFSETNTVHDATDNLVSRVWQSGDTSIHQQYTNGLLTLESHRVNGHKVKEMAYESGLQTRGYEWDAEGNLISRRWLAGNPATSKMWIHQQLAGGHIASEERFDAGRKLLSVSYAMSEGTLVETHRSVWDASGNLTYNRWSQYGRVYETVFRDGREVSQSYWEHGVLIRYRNWNSSGTVLYIGNREGDIWQERTYRAVIPYFTGVEGGGRALNLIAEKVWQNGVLVSVHGYDDFHNLVTKGWREGSTWIQRERSGNLTDYKWTERHNGRLVSQTEYVGGARTRAYTWDASGRLLSTGWRWGNNWAELRFLGGRPVSVTIYDWSGNQILAQWQV